MFPGSPQASLATGSWVDSSSGAGQGSAGLSYASPLVLPGDRWAGLPGQMGGATAAWTCLSPAALRPGSASQQVSKPPGGSLTLQHKMSLQIHVIKFLKLNFF